MIGIDFIKCVADLARDEEDLERVLAIVSPCDPNTHEWEQLLAKCKEECSKPWLGGTGHRGKYREVLSELVSSRRIIFPRDTNGEKPVIGQNHWVDSEKDIIWVKPTKTPA